MDHYRLLNVSRSASAKEIKDAYFRLGEYDGHHPLTALHTCAMLIAKTLHPDVTGNDQKKAELFKNVSEAHSVLSDANSRRQYDASRPAQNFGPQSTGGGRMHPYAAQKAAEAAARGYTGGAPDYTARRMYGIDEEVWIAHHYGVHSRRSSEMPNRYYGMNIVEERIEEEEERIQRRKQHYKLHSSAGYFLRREARLKKRAAEEATKAREEQKSSPKSQEEDTNCVIS